MLHGTVRKVLDDKKYGFIATDKTDYFFHKDNYDGHWDDLVRDYNNDVEIPVTFEPVRTDKGLRAEEVKRSDNG